MLSLRPLIAISMTLFIGALALAADRPFERAESPDLIITTLRENARPSEVLKASDPSMLNQDITLTYNPKDFEGVADTSGNKEELLKALRQEMIEVIDDKVVRIPKAPSNEEHFEKISALTEPEIQSFLGKKQKFLDRMAKVLGFFHIKPKTINKVLNEVNNKFYNSSRLIANSNSAGGTIMFSLSGGLALPKKLIEKLQDRPIGKYLPKSGGFFYLLGMGVGVSREVKPNGKPNWFLEVFADTETLKSAFTGVFEVSAAGTAGVVYELREGRFKNQTSDTTYGGLAGVFRQGESQFGWAASLGMGLPPGVGSILVFTNHSKRQYIFRVNLSNFTENYLESGKSVVFSWMDKTGMRKKPRLCSQVFSTAE